MGLQLTHTAGPARVYCERLLQQGILCKDTRGHTIRIAPPLVVEERDLEEAAAALERVLA